MADQKINELPTKTAPSTGDKMLMIGTAEEYQIDYDKLASAILDKLATKQYSELDTTAKTVLGALDELNSKSYLLRGGVKISKDADLNDYIDIGNYCCTLSVTALTLKNCPFDDAFTMKVEFATGMDYICQTIREFNSGKVAWRAFNSILPDQWSDWVYFSDDATVLADTSGSAKESHIISAYTAIKEELWQTWGEGVINETFLYSGPLYGIIGYKSTDNYGAFIILSYFASRPAYAYVNDGVWHDPVWI